MKISAIVIEGRPGIDDLTALLLALAPWGASMDCVRDVAERGGSLRRSGPDTEAARAEIDAIIDMVASDSGVARERIVGESRSPTLTPQRAAICWLARFVRGHLTTLIAEQMQWNDHSSAVHHSRRAFELRDSDADFRASTDRLAAFLSETGQ